MADGNYPDIYPDDPRGCAGCGRLPEQVEALAGPAAGPRLCVDCVDRARAAVSAVGGTCALCDRRTGASRRGARLGETELIACGACLEGLAAAMAELD
jgi:hypothetical protein